MLSMRANAPSSVLSRSARRSSALKTFWATLPHKRSRNSTHTASCKHSVGRMTSHGVLLRTVTTHSYMSRDGTKRTTAAKNATRTIASIAGLNSTRGSAAKNTRQSRAEKKRTRPFTSLPRAPNSSSVPSASSGSKNHRVATT